MWMAHKSSQDCNLIKMNQILNKLTEEEKKQVIHFWKKPYVSFSRVTLNDCVRPDGLALDLRFIEPFGLPTPSLHIPQEFSVPVPSDFLCQHYCKLYRKSLFWTMKRPANVD
jgi:hypothetical protein